MDSADTAMRSWELDNKIKLVDPTRDALYDYQPEMHKEMTAKKPWSKEPNYFQTVRISAVALIKMVMHARSGGSLEVMGLMQGYVDGTAFVVTDAFRLPVEGTETRVNAQDDANEYLVEYLRLCREQGRMENVVGWYHSHPGYGCWLSGIDVDTQHVQQQFNDPFVAVVVDPDRTISAGKVEIGAFRTYPADYRPDHSALGESDVDGYQMVPLSKAKDFGAHSNRYYSLSVDHFKSTLDSHLLELLWNKYWVQTLSQAPLLTNRDYGNKQMLDLSYKIKEVTVNLSKFGRSGAQGGAMTLSFIGSPATGKALDHSVEKVMRDSSQLAAKETAGLIAGEVKAKIFNGVGAPPAQS